MTTPIIKIVIVDDEVDICNHFLAFLEDYPEIQATVFYAGEKALQALPALQPDCCIVDMRLPGMSGAEFIVKAKTIVPHCRFLINTGSIDMNLSDELRRTGLDEGDLFYKPIDMEMVVQRIFNLLKKDGA